VKKLQANGTKLKMEHGDVYRVQ